MLSEIWQANKKKWHQSKIGHSLRQTKGKTQFSGDPFMSGIVYHLLRSADRDPMGKYIGMNCSVFISFVFSL